MSVLMPVFNDWAALPSLLNGLDAVFVDKNVQASVFLIDDASTEMPSFSFRNGDFRAILEIRIIRLRRNLGHQRAICIGLACLAKRREASDAVLVMDSDGEDKPSDVSRLIDRFTQNEEGRRDCSRLTETALKGSLPAERSTHSDPSQIASSASLLAMTMKNDLCQDAGGAEKIVFAQRVKRSEGWGFRCGYHSFRFLHRLLTGIPVQVGNFSLIPTSFLPGISVISEMWNHYAAAIMASGLPYDMVPTERGIRLHGQPHMSYTTLIIHGFRALSVFAEIIFTRTLIFSAVSIPLVVFGLLMMVSFPVFSGVAISPPVLAVSIFSLVLVLNFLLFMGGLALLVFFQRNNGGFLPERDHENFIGDISEIYSGDCR